MTTNSTGRGSKCDGKRRMGTLPRNPAYSSGSLIFFVRNTVPKQNKVNRSMKTPRSMSGSRTRTTNDLLTQSAKLVMFSTGELNYNKINSLIHCRHVKSVTSWVRQALRLSNSNFNVIVVVSSILADNFTTPGFQPSQKVS